MGPDAPHDPEGDSMPIPDPSEAVPDPAGKALSDEEKSEVGGAIN